MAIICICKQCNKEFYKPLSKIQRGEGKYCSRKCKYLDCKGKRFSPKTEFKKGVHYSLATEFKKGQKGIISFGMLGKHQTKYQKMRVSGENNHLWKGDKVSYAGLHMWIKNKLGKPIYCAICGKNKGRFEWANISKKYKRDLKDYINLCYSCHDKYDNVQQKVWNIRRLKYV